MAAVRDAFSSLAAGLGTLVGSTYDRTLSHTNGATSTDGALFVFVWVDSANDVVTNVTYNGVSAVELLKVHLTKWLYLARFTLPAAGAHNIVVTTSTQPSVAIAARSYTAAAQGDVAASMRAGGATNTVITISIDTIVDNSIVCMFAENDVGVPTGVGAGNTAVDLSKQRAAITEITGTVAAAGTQVYPQFTIGSTAVWEGLGFALGPYVAPTPPSAGWPNTTRDTIVKPALPTLGPAGYLFTDPAFGSRMGRVTDGNSTVAVGGSLNASFRTSSGSQQPIWNSNSSCFVLLDTFATAWLFDFNPTAMTWAVREKLQVNGEIAFSRTNPNYLYARGLQTNHNTIVRVDISTTPTTVTTVVDADVLIPALVGTDPYIQNVFTAYNDVLMFTTGGASEHAHYIVLYDLVTPANTKVLDTLTKVALFETYGIGPYLHSSQPDLSGRWIAFQPSGFQNRTDKFWLWDTLTDTFTKMTVAIGGHGAFGFGTLINQDTAFGTWDAAQWTFRLLTTPNGPGMRVLMDPILEPTEVYWAEHGNLNSSNPGNPLGDYTSGGYRYFDGPYNVDPKNLTPWRALDDEIYQVPTDGLGRPVKRFCHHRSFSWPEPVATRFFSFEFWPLPKANISPDGRWVLFCSNWEHTLDLDPYEDRGLGASIKGTTHREDVFMVEVARVAGAEPVVDLRLRRSSGYGFYAR